MYSRQSPSRNQRSKGIRVKHILQICLLLAVSFWLIYQVKHSHDKKKEFDETDAKTALHAGVNDDLMRLGRKDLPQVEETNNKKIETHDEDPDEEEENSKNDQPEDKKVAEGEEEDEVIDEHATEKPDEEEDENEIKEKDSEDAFEQTEKESSDGDDGEAHDSRDENYKADDASSAVTHDIQTVTTENSIEHHTNITEQENKENNIEESNKSEMPNGLEVENGEIAKEHSQSNVTTSQIKEKSLVEAEKGSSLNNTATHGSETENTSAEGSNFGTINNSTLDVDNKQFDTNSTSPVEIKDAKLISEDLSSSSNITDAIVSNTEFPAEENDTIDPENSDISDEILASEMAKNREDVLIDSIDLSDSSDSLEEKHVRTDLETLPEMQTQGTDSED